MPFRESITATADNKELRTERMRTAPYAIDKIHKILKNDNLLRNNIGKNGWFHLSKDNILLSASEDVVDIKITHDRLKDGDIREATVSTIDDAIGAVRGVKVKSDCTYNLDNSHTLEVIKLTGEKCTPSIWIRYRATLLDNLLNIDTSLNQKKGISLINF